MTIALPRSHRPGCPVQPLAWFGARGWCGRSRGFRAVFLLLFMLAAGLIAAGPSKATETGAPEDRPERSAHLVYYFSHGCPWCEQWEAEVLPAYPTTPEGQRLPLRRVEAGTPWPDDLERIRGVVYTPTFIVVDAEGGEVGRIVGYQPEWFWAYLGRYIERLDTQSDSDPRR